MKTRTQRMIAVVLLFAMLTAVFATAAAATDGNWYYYRDGESASGWECIEGEWHYFDPVTGQMATGMQYIDGDWYYFYKNTGIMAEDTTLTKAGTTYRFNSFGHMISKAASMPAYSTSITLPTVSEPSVSDSYTVYITKTGECYHTGSCSFLHSKIAMDKDEAVSSGYRACSRCHP